MSKRVQESNLKEGSALAKSKLLNLNLSSMRKGPSHEVRDLNSWENHSLDQHGVSARSCSGHKRWPTMYSQRRDESSAQPAVGHGLRSGEVHPSGKRKLEFKKYANIEFQVLGESLQERKEIGESCRRCTTSGDPSAPNQHIDLENVHLGISSHFCSSFSNVLCAHLMFQRWRGS